jgi:tetratricopeptide (TPR) repeat protein
MISNIMLELKEPTETWQNSANHYFALALQFSPKRPSTLIEWAKTDFLMGRYEEGKQKLLKAISFDAQFAEAYFMLGLGSIYQRDFEEADGYFDEANKRGIDMKDPNRLLQLVFVYNEIQNHEEIIKVMEKIIELDPKTIQHYASLATIYKKVGNIEKAKEIALKILEIELEANAEVEEFIRTLEQ